MAAGGQDIPQDMERDEDNNSEGSQNLNQDDIGQGLGQGQDNNPPPPPAPPGPPLDPNIIINDDGGDRASLQSSVGVVGGGLASVFKHVTKPVDTLIRVDRRNDPAWLARANAHLARINPENIQTALRSEEVIGEQFDKKIGRAHV